MMRILKIRGRRYHVIINWLMGYIGFHWISRSELLSECPYDMGSQQMTYVLNYMVRKGVLEKKKEKRKIQFRKRTSEPLIYCRECKTIHLEGDRCPR